MFTTNSSFAASVAPNVSMVANECEGKAISCHSLISKSSSFPHFGWHAPLEGCYLAWRSLQYSIPRGPTEGRHLHLPGVAHVRVSSPTLASALLQELQHHHGLCFQFHPSLRKPSALHIKISSFLNQGTDLPNPSLVREESHVCLTTQERPLMAS